MTNQYNNLMTAIMDIDDIESSSYSCEPVITSKSSSSSSSTSTSSSSTSTTSSSSTKQSLLIKESIISNDNDSNVNNNNKQLLFASSSLGESETNHFELIFNEVEAVLTQLVDNLVENEESQLLLVEESLSKLKTKVNDLRAAQCVELDEFYEQIHNYENLMQKLKAQEKKEENTCALGDESSSNTSLNLDEYFDFLNESNEKLDKDLRISLPDNFCLYLRNWFEKCSILVDVS